jgi:hypothetical protein
LHLLLECPESFFTLHGLLGIILVTTSFAPEYLSDEFPEIIKFFLIGYADSVTL